MARGIIDDRDAGGSGSISISAWSFCRGILGHDHHEPSQAGYKSELITNFSEIFIIHAAVKR